MPILVIVNPLERKNIVHIRALRRRPSSYTLRNSGRRSNRRFLGKDCEDWLPFMESNGGGPFGDGV